MTPKTPVASKPPGPGRQTLLGLFLRFLRLGAVAWGGPTAQIAAFRQEFVEKERWVDSDRFNRVLAVYQVLPGPEATELTVWFGMVARGRPGAIVAGLGFMLPGLLGMLLLSHLYTATVLDSPALLAAFAGAQAAVCALVCRAVFRIGRHALGDALLVAAAATAFACDRIGAPFALTLVLTGTAAALSRRPTAPRGFLVLAILLLAAAALALGSPRPDAIPPAESSHHAAPRPEARTLLVSGLRAGLLTFGGAYTAIPFVHDDAVIRGGWLSESQFVDGLALSGLIPAPLIIFTAFVGWMARGLSGALLMVLGVFAPAFGFTLLGHGLIEKLLDRPAIHRFLDGVAAGIVGLIAGTALDLLRLHVDGLTPALILVLSLLVLARTRRKIVIPAVVLTAALLGLILG